MLSPGRLTGLELQDRLPPRSLRRARKGLRMAAALTLQQTRARPE
jgi:hypothetical protein